MWCTGNYFAFPLEQRQQWLLLYVLKFGVWEIKILLMSSFYIISSNFLFVHSFWRGFGHQNLHKLVMCLYAILSNVIYKFSPWYLVFLLKMLCFGMSLLSFSEELKRNELEQKFFISVPIYGVFLQYLWVFS